MTDVNEYGRALFLIGEEEKTTENLFSEIGVVDEILTQHPDYIKILDTPALTHDEKHALLDEAFGTYDEMLLNLLKLLSDKCIAHTFKKAVKTYFALYDELHNIERVEAITAIPMTEAQLDALRKKLDSFTGKNVVITNTVDPQILGGVKIRYSGVQLDGSLKKRLDDFEQGIKNAVI